MKALLIAMKALPIAMKALLVAMKAVNFGVKTARKCKNAFRIAKLTSMKAKNEFAQWCEDLQKM